MVRVDSVSQCSDGMSRVSKPRWQRATADATDWTLNADAVSAAV